jgi:hypothetical protein
VSGAGELGIAQFWAGAGSAADGAGVYAGAGAAGLGAAAFFGALFFGAALFGAALFGAALAVFGAAFFAVFFGAAFFADFLADFFADFLADFFTDFLAAFLADFFEALFADFFAISNFFFLSFLPFLFFFPLAIVILLLPPISVHQAFQALPRFTHRAFDQYGPGPAFSGRGPPVAQSRSSIVCTTGTDVPPAICIMHPMLPAAIMSGLTLAMLATFRSRNFVARSGWRRL